MWGRATRALRLAIQHNSDSSPAIRYSTGQCTAAPGSSGAGRERCRESRGGRGERGAERGGQAERLRMEWSVRPEVSDHSDYSDADWSRAATAYSVRSGPGRPRPHMGASDRRTMLPARIGQTHTRSRARSRLARQNRFAIASWDNPVCPQAPHTRAAGSLSFGSDAEDGTSNSVVMMCNLTSATPPTSWLISWTRTSGRCTPGAG